MYSIFTKENQNLQKSNHSILRTERKEKDHINNQIQGNYYWEIYAKKLHLVIVYSISFNFGFIGLIVILFN